MSIRQEVRGVAASICPGFLAIFIAALTLAVASPVLAQADASAEQSKERRTFIHAGALLDRPGQLPRGNSTVIVRNGKIIEVRAGFVAPESDAQLIDLRKSFVLPGLIDMHVHVWGLGGDPLQERLTALNRDAGDDLLYAVANTRVTLEAGFTTVRDLGGDARGMRALRDAIERGDIVGPTIISAGRMISVSGGHGDGTNGVSAEFADTIRQHQVNVCNGADDCRRAVREQVSLGAQVIKFAATGGVLSNVSGGLGRALLPEEMRAIIETAHSLGRSVAAHSHAAEGTKAAVEAGVDTIDHGSFLDEEAIRLMKDRGTWLVPTMMATVTALEQARAGLLPSAAIPKAEQAAAAALLSHRKAIAAGVQIAFGTDSGVSRHGDNAREFALMVRAGMTPGDALQAATVSAAEALGRSDTIGSIEPGKDADIIAVEGDPLSDISRMERVIFVMRRGLIHKIGTTGN